MHPKGSSISLHLCIISVNLHLQQQKMKIFRIQMY
jgi:hypothetical protein